MGRTFNIYDRSGTSVVGDGVSQGPFLGSASCDKRYILEEARQKLCLPNSRKKKHFEEPSSSPHARFWSCSASLSADRCKYFFILT